MCRPSAACSGEGEGSRLREEGGAVVVPEARPAGQRTTVEEPGESESVVLVERGRENKLKSNNRVGRMMRERENKFKSTINSLHFGLELEFDCKFEFEVVPVYNLNLDLTLYVI